MVRWTRACRSRRRAEIDGELHTAFRAVADLFAQQIASSPGGAAVCVYHRGSCVVDLWGGVRDERGLPWQADTMAPSFSTSKGVASTLMHIMVDRGLLDYDDRVAEYWPEFAQAGKEGVTVRHVMAHQSGLYHIRQMIDHADRMLDWEYMVHAIERAEPVHPPGARTGYHGLTYGFIVGEILQRVTGASFAELVRRELAEPLGLDGLYIGAPKRELFRAAQLIRPKRSSLASRLPPPGTVQLLRKGSPALERFVRLFGVQLDIDSMFDALAPRGIRTFDFGSDETLRVSIPAANGLFTARSLARMYAMLAGGGEIDGVRLLSKRTLRRATRLQKHPGPLAVIPFDMRWRLGYHGLPTMTGKAPKAFGHFGFGGSGAFADPSRELAVAMIVNAGSGTPFGDLRIARISTGAIDAAQARRSPPRTSHPQRASSSARAIAAAS